MKGKPFEYKYSFRRQNKKIKYLKRHKILRLKEKN